MPAFTKGKWSYADVSTPYEQHFIIGTVDKTGTFYAHASTKTEADARLFSAAHDMYDALKECYDFIEKIICYDCKYCSRSLDAEGLRIALGNFFARIDGMETTSHDTDA